MEVFIAYPSLTAEKRSAYRAEADKFLEVLRRMADLEWTREDHAWLAQRNRSVLERTERGRQELASFDHAPLLMDGRRRNAAGEDGAEQFNAAALRRLSARTGQPILWIGASTTTEMSRSWSRDCQSYSDHTKEPAPGWNR